MSLNLDRTYEDPTIKEPKERELKFGQHDHVRIYAQDYKSRLESVGFEVDVYALTNEFGATIADTYQLIKEENLYICSKPPLHNHQNEVHDEITIHFR